MGNIQEGPGNPGNVDQSSCKEHSAYIMPISGWLSLLLVYDQSCLPKLLPINFASTKNNSDSSSTTPSSKASLFASVFASNSNLDDQGVQPHHFPLQNSLCHPLSSPHKKSAKPFCLTPPNPKALMVFQQQFSKPVLLNLPLFLTNYSSFPTLLAHFPPHGNKPTSFISQKKATSLIHSTIVPLQSLHSSLRQWRLSSLTNFLPSLKQTIFSLITSMAFQKPGLLVIFLLMLSMSGPLL